ncbi:MAG: hypothetical protein ACT4NX_08375 [Deltaproteobacteria bacterium]
MLRQFVLIAVLAISSIVNLSAEEVKSPIEIESVVSDPRQYDGKVISVEGVIEKLKHYTVPSGDHYTLFSLIDAEKNSIGVYTKGRLDVAKGDRLIVTGKFKKERRYALFKFKNVIKARAVEDVLRRDERVAKTN